MTLPEELTTVTRISKIVALIMFITLPIIAFVFGMRYQEALGGSGGKLLTPTPTMAVACTMEAKICPDGSAVGRVPPTCDFELCPNEIVDPGMPVSTFPSTGYECPASEYIDCEPGPELKAECDPSFIEWAQESCPSFKGAAY